MPAACASTSRYGPRKMRRSASKDRRYASEPSDVDQVRITETPEPHPRSGQRREISLHEVLMEVVAGPHLGMDPVGHLSHENHDPRLVLDIVLARDLNARLERLVEEPLHLIDRSDVVELLVAGPSDPEAARGPPIALQSNHSGPVGRGKRHVDGMGHLDTACRVVRVLVEETGHPVV